MATPDDTTAYSPWSLGFPDFDAPCPVCGEPADHEHRKWDSSLMRWVVVRREEDL